MIISTQEIKNAIKEVLAEQNEVGIQPIIIPPLEEQPRQDDTSVLTQDVVNSFLHYKEYKGVKEATVKTYKKTLHRFVRKYPILPLDTDTVLEYLDQFTGDTGRHKRNQHDRLNMLYKHVSQLFGIPENPMDNLERPTFTNKPIQTLSLKEVYKVAMVTYTLTERVVWEMALGHGWRQIEVRRITAGDVRAIRDGIIWCKGKHRDEYAPILPETEELLKQLADTLSDDDLIIRSKRIRAGITQPLGEDGMRYLIQGLFARSNMEYLGHDLRRTFCTLVEEASGSESLAMRLARDKIAGVNDRYINATPAKLGESLQKYSPIRLIKQMQAGESLVETGESRTPPETILRFA
jgi:integrase